MVMSRLLIVFSFFLMSNLVFSDTQCTVINLDGVTCPGGGIGSCTYNSSTNTCTYTTVCKYQGQSYSAQITMSPCPQLPSKKRGLDK